MEKAIEKIDELLKKKSKIGKGDALEAAELIYKVYCLNKDYDMLVNYLHDFYYKVSGIFVSEYYFKLNKEEQIQIIDSFLINKKFLDNVSGSSIFKGYSILTEIICKDSTDDNVLTIIKCLSKLAEKNNEINATSCKTFLNFLNETSDKFFDIDFSLLSDSEIKRLFRYICATIPEISTVSYSNKVQSWVEKYYKILPKQAADKYINLSNASNTLNVAEENGEVSQGTVPIRSTITPVELNSTKGLIKTLHSANQEAQKLFDNLFSKNNTIQSYQEKLNIKDQELNYLKTEIQNKNISVTTLNNEINKLKSELAGKQIEINDLTERLKVSFNVDDISKKQEIITLKNDIATAVKLQYEDFNEHKNEICNEDNYEALKVSLNQVFRTLKRYGIEL